MDALVPSPINCALMQPSCHCSDDTERGEGLGLGHIAKLCDGGCSAERSARRRRMQTSTYQRRATDNSHTGHHFDASYQCGYYRLAVASILFCQGEQSGKDCRRRMRDCDQVAVIKIHAVAQTPII